MNLARVWFLKPRARLIPILIGIILFIGAFFSFTTPHLRQHALASDRKELETNTSPGPHYRGRPRPWKPRPYPPPSAPSLWRSRADEVRAAFLHAYAGYKQFASPRDELLPLSNDFVNNFNGWGLTLFDALDTMWIMDLKDEFYDTLPIVANSTFALPEDKYAPFFETVIRYLGGLLSAYALSGEPVLLSRADDLGEMLLPAFNTAHGLPMYAVNTVTGRTKSGWTATDVLWSEALSCQLEYKYLAHLTGRTQYFDHVDHIMDIMRDANVPDGMFPTKWKMATARPSNNQFSVGAFADSAHEYLLKQWLLTSKSEQKAKNLYMKAVNGIIKHLLYLTPTRNLLYVTDTRNNHPTHVFEHLSCFLPGLLALGAHTLPLSPDDQQLHIWAAQGLAYTCWITYADHKTGLGPDEMLMTAWMEDKHEGRWLPHVQDWQADGQPGGVPPGLREAPAQSDPDQREYFSSKTGYLLRPETVESFYLLWRITGDEVWRERGWRVFESIERETKTNSGYASILDVKESPAAKKDEMPSFFMAETLKYLYLLFTDEELIPLDQWVFNTEAHPLPIFQWADWEVARYNISA